MTVKVVDRGWNAMIDRVNRCKSLSSKVGYPTGDAKEENGTSVLFIASCHEFGVDIPVTEKMRKYLHWIGIHLNPATSVIRIPMRSHVRAAYDEDIEGLTRMAEKLFGQVVDGTSTPEKAIARLGEYHANKIREKIDNGPFKPLHPITIQRKKSSKPLIDKGQMRQSVTHVEGVFA